MPITFPPSSPGLKNHPSKEVLEKFKQELTRPSATFHCLSLSSVYTLWIRSAGAEKQISYVADASEIMSCWVLFCKDNGQCSLLRLLADCTEMGSYITSLLLPIGRDGERQPQGTTSSNCTERYPKCCTKQRTELNLSSSHFHH